MTSARTSKAIPFLLRHAFIYQCPRHILQNLIFAAYVKTHENVNLFPKTFWYGSFCCPYTRKIKTSGNKIDENISFFRQNVWAKVFPYIILCPLQIKVIQKHKMKCEAFLSFFFFLFLYTVSLHGTPTGEIKLMELSESEQLTNFAILTFQPRSAFTFF